MTDEKRPQTCEVCGYPAHDGVCTAPPEQGEQEARSKPDRPTRADALAAIRHVAKQHGYAAAEHGSRVKDLDLILVPWTEDATADPAEVIESIVTALPVIHAGPEDRPHGRKGWALRFTGQTEAPGIDNWYIDVSAIPPSPEPSRRGGEAARFTIYPAWVAQTDDGPLVHTSRVEPNKFDGPLEVVEAASYDQLQQELEEARGDQGRDLRRVLEAADEGWGFSALDRMRTTIEALLATLPTTGGRSLLDRADTAEAQLQTASERIERLERALGELQDYGCDKQGDYPTCRPTCLEAGVLHPCPACIARAALATPEEEG